MKKILFFFFALPLLFATIVFAGNIRDDATPPPPWKHWAWNDVLGWVDFQQGKGSCLALVVVSDTAVTGCAAPTNLATPIILDCASQPPAGGCTSTWDKWKVTNTPAGLLGGFAWNDDIGWISFCEYDAGLNCVATNPSYRVKIVSNDFQGWAWNDVVGWINFNGPSSGESLDYRVSTDWPPLPPTGGTLTSSIFDAGSTVQFHSIVWNGQTNGGALQFYFASSATIAGPWTSTDFEGPLSTTDVNKTVQLDKVKHANHRYFRYKISLAPSAFPYKSPLVNDIIVRWGK